ncbi:MAG: type II toxin-antitoxin system HipA family toxin [Jiangellaceae bacterium]
MTIDLQELTGVDRAVVYKKGRPAARLTRSEDGVEFSYLPEYVGEGGAPVATTLPVTAEPEFRPAGAVPPFFAGLLPEGRRLSALRAAVKTSGDDELSLLLAVGGDTVGDVQILPEGADPVAVEPRVRVADWSEVSFADLFVEDVAGAVDRVGIPGVQDKVSAAMIAFPVSASGQRHILKLDPPEFPHLVENEAFMLAAARRSGLPTVDAEIVRDRDGVLGLLVGRFDRLPDGTMLAVEDGCQVLGRYPAAKYALTTEAVCTALATATDAPIVAGRVLLRWVAVAYVTCNGDLHAKNLAVGERPDGSYRVTPAYDLPSSYPYGDLTLALSINGKRREDVARGDLMALAAAVRVPDRAAAKVIDDVVGRVDSWLPELSELPYDVGVLTKWRRAVTYRARQLSRHR